MNMKKLTLLIFLLIDSGWQVLLACEVCKSNQPKVLENVTHGAGPSGMIDYVITWSAIILVCITLFLSIKYLIRPQENNPDHIKNIVLNENN